MQERINNNPKSPSLVMIIQIWLEVAPASLNASALRVCAPGAPWLQRICLGGGGSRRVSMGTLYQYFPDKQPLLLAVLGDRLDEAVSVLASLNLRRTE